MKKTSAATEHTAAKRRSYLEARWAEQRADLTEDIRLYRELLRGTPDDTAFLGCLGAQIEQKAAAALKTLRWLREHEEKAK